MDNKQCSCNKPKVVNDLLKRISNLEFEVEDKDRENERLNKIINGLEKDLEDMYYGRGKYHMDSDVIGIKDVLNKIKELKGSDSNE